MKTFPRVLILFLIAVIPAQQGWSADVRTVTSSLERAKELILSNKPAEALEALSSFSPLHPEMSAYHYAYARALVALKRAYESIEHYRLAYIYAPSWPDKERLLLERADVYSAMKYYSEAAVCYEVFLKQFPDSRFAARAELGIAEACFKDGEYRRALAHYERAGTSVRALMGKADTLQTLGRIDEARELYRGLIEHDPAAVNASPETLYLIGENFRRTGSPSDARVYYNSVKDPVFRFRAALGLGMLSLDQKNYDAAFISFKTAAASPERAVRRESVLMKAEAQIGMGRESEAREALEDIRTTYPYGKQYDRAVLLLAQIDRKDGKFTRAAELLKSLIYRRTPDRAALDQIESMILEAKDRNPEEFVRLWKATGRWLLDPSRTGTIVKVAQALQNAGRPFIVACAWLIRHGAGEGKDEGRLLLAGFYARMGDASSARSFLNRVKLKGRDDEIVRVKSRIYLAEGDARRAADAIMSLRAPSEKDLLGLLDLMLGKTGADRRAVAFCERFFEQNKVAAETVVRFADLLYGMGREREALGYYRSAAARKPGTGAGEQDIEWAHYRIADIAHGAERTASLKTIQTAKNAFGRFAAEELAAADLPGGTGKGVKAR